MRSMETSVKARHGVENRFSIPLVFQLTPHDLAISQRFLLDDKGEYPSPSTERGWLAAERVQLKKNSLLIWWFPETGEQQLKSVRPDKDLFVRFQSLAQSSNDDIFRFVTKYGSIHVFSKHGIEKWGIGSLKNSPTVEFCEVYRYFARVTISLFALAGSLMTGPAVRNRTG